MLAVVLGQAQVEATVQRSLLGGGGLCSRMSVRGGGHSGTEWLPTAKWLCGAEAVSTKI